MAAAAASCRTIVQTLEQNGHRVIATDLYREGFDPVMTIEERRSYMAMDSSTPQSRQAFLKKVGRRVAAIA